ncbi:MAG: hypothetical protein ACKPKO_37295, partial [Candidatus Fonsibacter sp.]
DPAQPGAYVVQEAAADHSTDFVATVGLLLQRVQYVMVMNSGVFVNERGTSFTFIGLLTKHDVLDALQQ